MAMTSGSSGWRQPLGPGPFLKVLSSDAMLPRSPWASGAPPQKYMSPGPLMSASRVPSPYGSGMNRVMPDSSMALPIRPTFNKEGTER
ncbi:hypothetical protein EYF80_043321 [Liparis tanakae]|uniref:Uncharacterized protein n=1 Tax=Liparis tanakae TaxID=230148 RepID=A0A4Z2G0N9_9TELE|nr:hypothetical protein EYF80_043321 [Liparis tanakae]